ncbi:MAG TPA: hypothetical protein VM369_08390 [Candidatus Binatia bacterium]|nr:hypothetical protein [Candidatus Binatia bacterium]
MAADGAGRTVRDAAGHRSFVAWGDYRYLKIAGGLCGISVLLYAVSDPVHGHRGNTWLGYTLGTVGLALIGWLAWYGVRKRQLADGRGTAQEWVSAHVYLGLSLLVVATLHSGFQLGWNVHGLAYVLMLLVIASGGYGVLAYVIVPRRITENRRQMDPDAMQAEVRRLDEAALRIADRIDPETQQMVAQSATRVQIGGSLWQQLSGRYATGMQFGTLGKFLERKAGQIKSDALVSAQQQQETATRQVTLMYVAEQMFEAGRNNKSEELQKLLNTIAQRKALVERLNRDITLRARQNVWLFLHVPLTVALLVAMVVHVVTVFIYW